MLAGLPAQEPDKIIRLMSMFAADDRPGKIDLGVGVYRTETGETPILKAVKTAEARLLDAQLTKGYTALSGDPAFHRAMADLVLGNSVPQGQIAALATPGGTGAVRQGLEMAIRANPDMTLWLSAPTWPNHPAIAAAMDVPVRTYRYYDPATGIADLSAMLDDLAQAKTGDVVLLHGCCHNPSGADLSRDAWEEVARLCGRLGLLPMVDLAYQGFGDGLEADTAGLRHLATAVPEMLVAVSGSKNFGLYRDRVGILLACCPDGATRDRVAGTMDWLNRLSYAFPPDHGARVVTTILTDPDLRQSWESELDAMRLRLIQMRQALSAELGRITGTDRFEKLRHQRGMFSLLGATPDQVAALRTDHGVYMVGDSRINLAGLTIETVPSAAAAIAAAMT
ncbi:aromatic amino acid transaminase [Actibacterium sp. 188UL27-1]|uniref:amino acid aminotransferase n=1 Tax=Actibacterium sp. 188UL27-1 TaxID=2786961 RepID=UPI00351C7059